MTHAEARRSVLPREIEEAFAAIEASLASLMDVCGMDSQEDTK